ncbi:MAG: FAD-binding oxidoreductase [Xanthomonadales bacterium]
MTGSGRGYDAVIIGAGSVGVPAAYFMAQAGLRVRVLDRYASVGQGANKAAIGGVRATHSDVAKIRIGLKSIEILSTWEETWGHNIEWHTGGYTFVAYREHEAQVLNDLLTVQHAHGLNIDWLDRDALLTAVPALRAEGLLGGTLSPEDGNASPLLTLHAFYDRACALGAEFGFGETVTGIDTDGGRVRSVRTDRARYATPVVVNAAGAQARDVARLAGLDVPVTPDSHEGGVTEPVARFLEPMVVDTRPLPGSANFYFYQHHTGQVVFCITPDPPIVGTDRRETSSFLPLVSRRMIDIMPRLRHIKVRRTWRGLYPMTPDGAPIVGWSREIEGFAQAVGMCGQGFMLGPGLGTFLARLVSGDLEPGDEAVFEQLSPYRSFAATEQLK